jgi:hypothetical protein
VRLEDMTKRYVSNRVGISRCDSHGVDQRDGNVGNCPHPALPDGPAVRQWPYGDPVEADVADSCGVLLIASVVKAVLRYVELRGCVGVGGARRVARHRERSRQVKNGLRHAENPVVDGLTPICTVDVWEQAYRTTSTCIAAGPTT